jgi:ABC-type glutathione transport system ATPase component
MADVLEIANLSVRYNPDQFALHEISLCLKRGQTLGLVGHSGSGKSTLALAIMGLLPKSCEVRGKICFQGRDLLGQTECQLRGVRGASMSMVWQEPSASLNPVMTIESQIDEVLRAHFPAWPRSQRHDRVWRALNQVELGDTRVMRAYPCQLSGGQLQRAVIAQALVCSPALILADEPAASLDSVTQKAILTLLRKQRDDTGLSLLFITHNESLLREFADRVVRLQEGRVAES